jgi:hypothetical protein
MKFRIGQEVTPTKRHFEVVFGKMEEGDMPEFGKIYTVAGYPLESDTRYPLSAWGMMQLEERKPNKLYHERHFEAVLPAEAIEEALENVSY